jgi:hypothetical protein
VKEAASIHLQLTAAEPPVRSQEEVEPEDFVFGFIQNAFGNQRKIRDVFLIPSAPDLTAIFAADEGQPSLADVLLLLYALPESGIAGSKDRPQDTAAGHIRPCLCAAAQSNSLALHAVFFCQRDRFRAIPLKVHEFPPDICEMSTNISAMSFSWKFLFRH